MMESAENFKTDGNEKYKQKKYKEAIESYSKAIDLEPDNVSFYLNRAAAQLMVLSYREVGANIYLRLLINLSILSSISRSKIVILHYHLIQTAPKPIFEGRLL